MPFHIDRETLNTLEELEGAFPEKEVLERTLKWKSYLDDMPTRSNHKKPSIKELNALLERVGFQPKTIKQAKNFRDKLKLVSEWHKTTSGLSTRPDPPGTTESTGTALAGP